MGGKELLIEMHNKKMEEEYNKYSCKDVKYNIDRYPTIVVDVDGTLFTYDEYEFGKFGDPKIEVIDFIRNCHIQEMCIAIQTSRSWAEYNHLVKILKDNRIPYDIINMGSKCIGKVYLDDRCVNVNNKCWKDDVKKLLHTVTPEDK